MEWLVDAQLADTCDHVICRRIESRPRLGRATTESRQIQGEDEPIAQSVDLLCPHPACGSSAVQHHDGGALLTQRRGGVSR